MQRCRPWSCMLKVKMKFMKRILVPTDFSKVSGNALQFAIYLGNHFGGHIDVVHTYDVIRKTGHLKSMEGILHEDARKDMDKLLAGVFPQLQSQCTIGSYIAQGDTGDIVTRKAKRQDYDFIVMGTQGSSNAMEVFIGSTALSVIKKSETPVIVVPESASFEKLGNIVFCVDQIPFSYSPNTLAPVPTIADKFNAHLHLLHVGSEDENWSDTQVENTVLNGSSFSFHNIDDDDVFGSINKYADDVDADLIIMVRRKKSFFAKIVEGSHTRKELFHTNRPLMILQD